MSAVYGILPHHLEGLTLREVHEYRWQLRDTYALMRGTGGG